MKNSLYPLHIRAMLKKQARKKHLSFHTPGHKKRGADITELSYSDNLSAPTGCLLQAERDITRILGAKRSFILTDGSTCGVLSMLYALKLSGAKSVAFPVQSHKSVFHGCEIFSLTPLLFPCSPTAEQLQGEWKEIFQTADAILLTSPSYYGEIPDLSAIKAVCQIQNKPLLIDGAHGGHLHFEKSLYAGSFADMWVDGVHKSLPAKTQGAVVSAKQEFWAEKLARAVDIFRTTSPSYPIMESVEYAVKYPQNKKLETLVRAFAKSCARVQVRQDYTKLCVVFGEQAFSVQAKLEKQGIYPEFCDGEIVMFYLSPATKIRQFHRLKKVLLRLMKKYPYIEQKTSENIVQRNPAPLVFEDLGEKEWVDFKECEGRICAQNCGLFPPCTPLILKGEKIEKEKLEFIQKASACFGVCDGKILVFKE